jgi:anti-sigma B factor antagonist
MKLTYKEIDGVMVLEPKGRIMGGPDATVFHDRLHDFIGQNQKKVVINLAKVELMNSTGLGILISGLTTLRNNGGELKLACITDRIESLLTITKLITVFDNYDTIDQAVKSFQ